MAWRSLALAAIATMTACGSGLRETPRASHPSTSTVTPVQVEQPPPDAHIEEVGPAPAPGCEWSDGLWAWTAGEWRWSAGQWVRNDGCYRADLTTIWISTPSGSGALFAVPTAWYEIGTDKLCPPPPACTSG